MRAIAGLICLLVGGAGVAMATVLMVIHIGWILLMLLIGFSWDEVVHSDQTKRVGAELMSYAWKALVAGAPFLVAGIVLSLRKKSTLDAEKRDKQYGHGEDAARNH